MKESEMRRNRKRHELEEDHHSAHLWKRDRRRQRQFKRTILLLTVPLLLIAGACGGASDAGEAGSENKGPADSTKKSSKDEQKAFLDFARCMRENGVPMPDPEFKGSGEVSGVKIGGPDISPQEMEEAQKACRKHLPQSATGDVPKLSDRDQDAFLAFSRCMRDKGVNVPDPKPGDGGLVFRIGDPKAADIESDEFKEAEEACRKHLAPLDRRLDRERG